MEQQNQADSASEPWSCGLFQEGELISHVYTEDEAPQLQINLSWKNDQLHVVKILPKNEIRHSSSALKMIIKTYGDQPTRWARFMRTLQENVALAVEDNWHFWMVGDDSGADFVHVRYHFVKWSIPAALTGHKSSVFGLFRHSKLISHIIMDSKCPLLKLSPHTQHTQLHVLKIEKASQHLLNLNSSETSLVCPIGDNPEEWVRFGMHLRGEDHERVAIIQRKRWEMMLHRPKDWAVNASVPLHVTYKKLPQITYTLARPRTTASVTQRQNTSTAVIIEEVEHEETPPQQVPKTGLMHPRYVKAFSQNHASWIFGGLAELIDNARDACAQRLDIIVRKAKLLGQHESIPVLQVKDDGNGLDPKAFSRMLSFCHDYENATADNLNRIGCFGVGFKAGSMRIGDDVLVLTKKDERLSMGLLSTSLNKGKDVLEIPMVTWKEDKTCGRMAFDEKVQSPAEAKKNLTAMKEHGIFHDEMQIGNEFGTIPDTGGTKICIFNLEKWGNDYSLGWDMNASCKNKNDIVIKRGRPRNRPGQTSAEVPLDCSLRAYLEVLYDRPKMDVYIQGEPVKMRRLEKSLTSKRERQILVHGKQLLLTLGFCPEEKKLRNCGVFLYWRGRLVEAYKRCGKIMLSGDEGLGVIGVLDTTTLYGDAAGGLLSTKQGFQDTQVYADLEKAIATEVQEFWDQCIKRNIHQDRDRDRDNRDRDRHKYQDRDRHRGRGR